MAQTIEGPTSAPIDTKLPKKLSQKDVQAKIDEVEEKLAALIAKHNIKVDADINPYAEFNDLVSFETKVQFLVEYWD